MKKDYIYIKLYGNFSISPSNLKIKLINKCNKIVFDGKTDNFGKVKIPVCDNKVYKLIVYYNLTKKVIPLIARANEVYCINIGSNKNKKHLIAILLKDAIRRAKKNPQLKDIVGRMHLVVGNSIELLSEHMPNLNLIYLDPMFPESRKSGLTNKKLQLIRKMEPPCFEEEKLFEAAIKAAPDKVIVKRPLKSDYLAGKSPNYSLNGKAIRYDCYC